VCGISINNAVLFAQKEQYERSAISRNTEPTRNENKSKAKGMNMSKERETPKEKAQQAKEDHKGMIEGL
jgi:hypothetical protein